MRLIIETDDPRLRNSNFTDMDADYLTAFLSAATAAIENYCGRIFHKTTYSQVLTSGLYGKVLLPQFPVVAIHSVASSQAAAVAVKHTGSTSAAVYLGSDSALFRSVTLGVKSSNSLAYASYPTIGSLATAVGLLSGWTATVADNYSSFPTLDLVAEFFGSATAEIDLPIWIEDDASYSVNSAAGILMGLGRHGQYRIEWEAGYTTIPDDLKNVCFDICKNMFSEGASELQSVSLGNYSYTLALNTLDRMPITARQILDSYRSGGNQ